MELRISVLIVFVTVLSVAQGLKCNRCQSIDKNRLYCAEMEEVECRIGQTNCIRLIMHDPAYGEIRRCATTTECKVKVPQMVERECCDTNLCN